MFPDDSHYDDRDRRLVATALIDMAGNPHDLEPGSDAERAYQLLEDLAAARGVAPTSSRCSISSVATIERDPGRKPHFVTTAKKSEPPVSTSP